MSDNFHRRQGVKYPLPMRIAHWLRAVLILGLIACGWYMTGLAEDDPMAAILYPNHKQFGILVWLIAVATLGMRWYYKARLPHEPDTLKPWEKWLSHVTHRMIIALTLLVPLFGYAMSSTYIDSDGVPFFFVASLPELLPKSATGFTLFHALHVYSAYLLLACVVLHVSGAIKHRLEDRNGATDVLPRML